MQNRGGRSSATVRRVLSHGRARAARYFPVLGPEPEASAPATNRSRYEPTWSPPTKADALLAIYNTESEASFEEGGRLDHDRLMPYYDRDSVVLDLGCGIGRVARYVAPECRQLYAVDVSARMLELASERMRSFDNVTYVLGQDVAFPQVPSGSVDLAYSLLVLQHVEREDAFLLLEELRRVVKPTGAVVLTFPNLLSDVYLESFLTYAHSGASTEPARARIYTPEEVGRLLPAAGFSAEIVAETEIRVVARPIV